MISANKKKRKIPTRSGSGEEDKEWKAETEGVGIEVDEEKETVLSREREAEKIRKVRTERPEEMVTENREAVENEVKKEEIRDTISTSSGGEPESEPEVKVLDSTMKSDYSI